MLRKKRRIKVKMFFRLYYNLLEDIHSYIKEDVDVHVKRNGKKSLHLQKRVFGHL